MEKGKDDMSRSIFLLLIMLSIQFSVNADTSKLDCNEEFTKPKEILIPLYLDVVSFARDTCQSLKSDELRSLTDFEYLTGNKSDGSRDSLIDFYEKAFDPNVFPDVTVAIEAWSKNEIFQNRLVEYNYNSELDTRLFELTAAYSSGQRFGFHGPERSRLGIQNPTQDMEQACSGYGYENCKSFFADIDRVTTIQNSYIKKRYSDETLLNVRQIRDDWTKFSDESRFQTPLDILFTSWIYHDELSDGKKLVPPPSAQYFLLRPSVVVDHFSDTSRGDRDELGLAVEWLGFNRWDDKIPWGISITSVYADRQDGKSIGHGLMFHVNNTLSFGFANRGSGENSIYVSIELMDWFGDKKDKYKSYMK